MFCDKFKREKYVRKCVHQFYLSKKDTKKIEEEIKNRFRVEVEGIEYVGNRVIELDKDTKIFVLGKIILIREKEKLFPSLACEEKFLSKFPSIKVDVGAIPYICRGAKIMRPGIVTFEKNFNLNDIVCIKENNYNKFIAIGEALMNKEDAKKREKGPVLDNLHYIGDKYWIFLKNARII